MADYWSFDYFGRLSVVCGRDFSNLEPLCTEPINKGDDSQDFHVVLNSFVEVDGQHRFQDDETFGAINRQLRNDCVTKVMTLMTLCCYCFEIFVFWPNTIKT
jgi:hypothetical protein